MASQPSATTNSLLRSWREAEEEKAAQESLCEQSFGSQAELSQEFSSETRVKQNRS